MPPSSFHHLRLGQAQSLLMQGRREEAANVYRQVLAEDPRNAAALHLLGLLMMQGGQLEPGLELVRQSLAIQPDDAAAQENFGLGLERLGRGREALAAFDRLAALAPTHVNGYAHRSRVLEAMGRTDEALADIDRALSLANDAVLLLNRGAILLQLRRAADAVLAFDKAIAASGGQPHPLVHFNRGVALTALGQLEDALASYDEALRCHPDYGDAFINRGRVLDSLGRADEALASFDRALAVSPGSAIARANRLALLARMGRRQEALAGLDAAIAAQPDSALAYNDRGAVLNSLGELAPALADFDQAIALHPDFLKAHSNRAIILQALGAFAQSLAAFDHLIALDPASTDTRLDKGFLLLLLGRYAEGLPLYELRARPVPPGLDPARAWAGPSQDPAGKTVLVYPEQGLGDVILFSRYLLELSARGANVALLVPAAMMRLLRSLPVPVTLVAADAMPQTPPDFHAPLLSLPLLLGTRVETIAAPVPYLVAEPEKVAHWRARLGSHGFRIAIAWQGRTRGTNDPRRSFPLAAMAPLAAVPGVRLIGLQRGEGSEELDRLPAGMTVERLGADFDGGGDAFIDSAAVMECCDLVITPDTSIAHLAGALGRPVWTALKSVPEWRWLLERTDTPWYPTMTLYRQPRFGDWESVFAAMARDLEGKVDRT
jgi:tetratricopeptide (TPR) repeat protein